MDVVLLLLFAATPLALVIQWCSSAGRLSDPAVSLDTPRGSLRKQHSIHCSALIQQSCLVTSQSEKKKNGTFIAISSGCYHMIWWALVLLKTAVWLRWCNSTFYLLWWMIKVRYKERQRRDEKEKESERKSSWQKMVVDLVELLLFLNSHDIKDPVQDIY